MPDCHCLNSINYAGTWPSPRGISTPRASHHHTVREHRQQQNGSTGKWRNRWKVEESSMLPRNATPKLASTNKHSSTFAHVPACVSRYVFYTVSYCLRMRTVAVPPNAPNIGCGRLRRGFVGRPLANHPLVTKHPPHEIAIEKIMLSHVMLFHGYGENRPADGPVVETRMTPMTPMSHAA
jgi:hypothetical protein